MTENEEEKEVQENLLWIWLALIAIGLILWSNIT